MKFTAGSWDEIARLKGEMDSADAIVIGAGSGLSTSAGFTYMGSRFEENFGDFIEKYGFRDMYSGGFILQDAGRVLGLLEPLYLEQPVSGCPEGYLPTAFAAGGGKRIFRADHQRGSLFSKSRL